MNLLIVLKVMIQLQSPPITHPTKSTSGSCNDSFVKMSNLKISSFLGKEVDHPWHLISYHSTFRKLWELLIMGLIIYGIFWYPLAMAFLDRTPWPTGVLIVEIVSIAIFILDILVNIRTTYSNENNEEIIDSKMMKRNYMKSRLFLIDVITVLPIPEILLIVLIGSAQQWFIYSLVILIRMLRVFKILIYLKNRNLKGVSRLLRLFVTFFLIVRVLERLSL